MPAALYKTTTEARCPWYFKMQPAALSAQAYFACCWLCSASVVFQKRPHGLCPASVVFQKHPRA
jgi:hypothetical protein